MSTVCPKCDHVRNESDDLEVPAGQCPACGIFYEKFLKRKAAEQRKQSESASAIVEKKQSKKISKESAKHKAYGEKFCLECAEAINAKAEICPKCGVRQPVAAHAAALNGKSKIAAALFALFLGGIGAHKFYLGQVGWGFIYLLFCWTLVPAIISFIEFILYLMMTNDTFNRKYGY